MRLQLLIANLLLCCAGALAQDQIKPEDKALFEQFNRDGAFRVISVGMFSGGFRPADLAASNLYKWQLYRAYMEQAPEVAKVAKRMHVGLEGQYTITYFLVDRGEVTVAEAYFGDPSGSKDLQYIHVYKPKEIKIGYLGEDRRFVPLSDAGAPEGIELLIGYPTPSWGETRTF